MAWNRAAPEALVRAMRAPASAAAGRKRSRMRGGCGTPTPPAGPATPLVRGGSRDGSGSPIEPGVGQTGVIGLAVEQMDEGRLPRAFVGVAAQGADSGGGELG